MLRLDKPGPGVAVLSIHRYNGKTTASICVFLYGDGADALASQFEPQLRDWMTKTFPPQTS
jgi:hypothetical protein